VCGVCCVVVCCFDWRCLVVDFAGVDFLLFVVCVCDFVMLVCLILLFLCLWCVLDASG